MSFMTLISVASVFVYFCSTNICTSVFVRVCSTLPCQVDVTSSLRFKEGKITGCYNLPFLLCCKGTIQDRISQKRKEERKLTGWS